MFCGRCGNNMSDSAKFCTKCGWKVPVGDDVPVQNANKQESIAVTQDNSGIQGGNLQPQQAGQRNMQMNVADSAPVVATPAPMKPKKKSKLWLWILLIVLVLGLGAGGTWAYFTYFASEEEDSRDDEDEDDKDDRDDEDEDDKDDRDDEDADDSQELGGLAGAYVEYVEKSKATSDISLIGMAMDALMILAADPSITWNGEVVYVRFTANGIEYGSDNETVIANMKSIMGDNNEVMQLYGFELWAKKEENGCVSFATSWDYDEMADISPYFADRFDITSVEP